MYVDVETLFAPLTRQTSFNSWVVYKRSPAYIRSPICGLFLRSIYSPQSVCSLWSPVSALCTVCGLRSIYGLRYPVSMLYPVNIWSPVSDLCFPVSGLGLYTVCGLLSPVYIRSPVSEFWSIYGPRFPLFGHYGVQSPVNI